MIEDTSYSKMIETDQTHREVIDKRDVTVQTWTKAEPTDDNRVFSKPMHNKSLYPRQNFSSPTVVTSVNLDSNSGRIQQQTYMSIRVVHDGNTLYEKKTRTLIMEDKRGTGHKYSSEIPIEHVENETKKISEVYGERVSISPYIVSTTSYSTDKYSDSITIEKEIRVQDDTVSIGTQGKDTTSKEYKMYGMVKDDNIINIHTYVLIALSLLGSITLMLFIIYFIADSGRDEIDHAIMKYREWVSYAEIDMSMEKEVAYHSHPSTVIKTAADNDDRAIYIESKHAVVFVDEEVVHLYR